jgi:sensor domain CHASE-containing protein
MKKKQTGWVRRVLHATKTLIRKVLIAASAFAFVAGAVHVGEVTAAHQLQDEALVQEKAQEQQWLKWQQDQIKQFQKDHSGSHPETKDFQGANL